MSTQSWSTRVRHDSDATWQEWRDEFITRLGLLTELAADETNITPGAGARPSANTEGGYAVYHLDDTMHATAPVYIRFGFGTFSGADFPRIQITVGTSTNGSGVLGGTALTTIRSCLGQAQQNTDTARQSYFSANEGFFGLNWKVGAGSSEASFFVCRSCDAAGDPTAEGAMVHWGQGSNSGSTARQALRFAATAAAFTAQTILADQALGFNPQARSTTLVGTDPQALMAYTPLPRISPLAYVCGVLPTEATPGSTFEVAMVGETARTFLVWSAAGGPFGPLPGSSAGGMVIAMLWE